MADNLRFSAQGQNPTFINDASKEEQILGDKAVGGMDDDADHVGNVIGGLKASINNPQVSEKAKKEAEAKLATLEGKQV